MKKLIFIFCICSAISGCSHQQFYINSKLPKTYPYEDKSNFFIGGIGQTDHINAKEICGNSSVDLIETSYSITDGILNLFTYGIYAPKTYKYGVATNKKYYLKKKRGDSKISSIFFIAF